MNTKKTLLLFLILVNLIGMAAFRPAASLATNHLGTPIAPGNRATPQVVIPKITKATIEKKDLIIEGQNFGIGATVLFNGTKTLKTRNDDVMPAAKLIVKKGRNFLPIDEVISLQVKNPNGDVSDAIGFFTGLTFSYQNTQNGVPNVLRVDQVFLLSFDDPDIGWSVHDSGRLGEVVDFVNGRVPQLPSAQGLFFSKHTGLAFFRMEGVSSGMPPFLWLVNLDIQ